MIYVKGQSAPPVEYYTKDQADAKGIKYIHWKECSKAGQWLISDDGYVLKCKRFKVITEIQYKKTGRKRFRNKIWTGLSISFSHQGKPLLIAEHIRCKDFGYYPRPWWKRFDINYPAVRHLLMKLVLTGELKFRKDLHYSYSEFGHMCKIANKMFDPKNGKTVYNVKQFFGVPEVRDMIRQDILDIAKKKGVTIEKVFELLAKAEEYGNDKKDGKVLIAIAKEYAGIVGMAALKTNNGDKQLPPTDEDDSKERLFDSILPQEEPAHARPSL